ncbi:MAG TPA: ice-binding family protein [Gracilimonas sp.]|uniref:ice-binding family protein n=1 Tax=Gracilimonas sp. TaxID=1974203 RepID=UPI002D82EEE5|nr:ice-binding family protein [Gracilimonas sp.]
MKSIKTIFKYSTFTALFLAVFMVGCDSQNNGDPDNDAPTVLSTNPANNDADVARNMAVTITFSEAMDPTTINANTFTLKQGTTTVPGDVTYSGTTATYTPTDIFSAGEVYTANISTGAKSAQGVALSSNTEWDFTTAGSEEPIAAVDLGTAGNYVILAKTAINNNPTSAITGDLGLSPAATSYITGFALTDNTGYATSDQVTGQIFAADMADPTPSNLTTAVGNMETAYNNAAGRENPDFVELYDGDIGGKTLTSGLYKWTSDVIVPASVTISGSADDVWIFQIAGNLNLSSDVEITLSDGAQAENIFWQVAGEVTAGTGSHFEGVILSMTGITLNTGATLNGRMLAQTAVILDANIVVEPQ